MRSPGGLTFEVQDIPAIVAACRSPDISETIAGFGYDGLLKRRQAESSLP
ncbi:hypothetical protein [Mesorhizobium escarrei]|uniref:Uncharacterized protein n=1 Tax=Mesorhizobium escarrei TaxID=666018 RepID=A0ABM9EH07_9HYPH|nr:hypothetical protein [Mesorhizobium escarrei]CAH2408116.1 hypothetical protein MES5069_650057 [Mesorhizobium escarrei]